MINGNWPAGEKTASLLVNGVETNDRITSIVFEDDINGDSDDVKIGSAVAAKITVVVDKPSLTYTGCKLVIRIAGIPMGEFHVIDTGDQDGRLAVTAMDAMDGEEMAADYEPDGTETSALGVIGKISTDTGIPLGDMSGIADIAVSDLKSGLTRREMLGRMAGVLGYNAHISRTGELVLRWYAETAFEVTSDNYYSGQLKKQDEDFTIDRIECSVTKTVKTTETDEDSISTVTESTETTVYSAGNGSSGISIADEYMTQAALDAIYTRLGGFSYRPMSVSFYGDVRVETGDLVTVADASGAVHTVPVMKVTHVWDGGVKTTITAAGKTASGNSAKSGGSLKKAVSNLEAEFARFKDLEAENIRAQNGRFQNILAKAVRAAQAYIETVHADRIDVSQINLMDYYAELQVPSENDQSSLLSGQTITSDGWIKNTDGSDVNFFEGICSVDSYVYFESKEEPSGLNVVVWWDPPEDRNKQPTVDEDGTTTYYFPNDTRLEENSKPVEAMGTDPAPDSQEANNIEYISDISGGYYRCILYIGRANTYIEEFSVEGVKQIRHVEVFPGVNNNCNYSSAHNIYINSKGFKCGKTEIDRFGNTHFGGSIDGIDAEDVRAVPAAHDILPRPEEDIPENGDLNDYWDPGVYRIMDAGIAATVDNVPYSGSGAKVITMTTSSGGNGRYSVQIYIANGTDILIWIRYKAAANATPGPWKRVTMQGEITAATLSALQYVSQSLTSAQQNQALTNLGLASNLKAAASVAASTFFTTSPLSSGTYDIRKTGNTISFYAYFASAPSSGTVRSGYRPCGGTSGHYAVLPLFSKSSPYTPVGTMWINGSGAVTFYGASNGGYVSGSYVCT